MGDSVVEVDNPGEALGSGKSEKSEGSSGTDGQAGLGSCSSGGRRTWGMPVGQGASLVGPLQPKRGAALHKYGCFRHLGSGRFVFILATGGRPPLSRHLPFMALLHPKSKCC